MMHNLREIRNTVETVATKQPWELMKLTYVGQVGEVLQGGGGKCPVSGNDPGDARKQKGSI